MAYQALYRKWRPATFEEVKGQDHIVTTLKNQIRLNRVGHAYLFCGTRGTGKTSIAKIFARAVNCEHPVDGSPCNECAMCRAANEGRSMNVIEIDAASNNGVDNIRQIRDEVSYSPSEGRYKVYIIDEVHMLSIGAFNALLKTLEEPPSYVIFILATTEAHKIPITILSRCQRYDFRRISSQTIGSRLRELAAAEQLDVEDAAIDYVARMADGSMRDALSLLDQCIAFYIGQKLSYENVLEVLGAVDNSVFGTMLRMITRQDTTSLLKILDEIIMQGRELTQFTVDFTWYLRNLLMVSSGGDVTDIVEASPEQLDRFRQEAALTDPDTLMRYIRIFSDLSGQIRYATQKRVLVEVALIKLCQPAMDRDLEALMNRMAIMERKLEEGVLISANAAGVGAGGAPGAGGFSGTGAFSGNGDVSAGNTQEAPKEKALSEDAKQVVARWKQMTADLSASMAIMLKGAKVDAQADGTLKLALKDDMKYDYFSKNEKNKEALEEALSERLGKQITVVPVLMDQEVLQSGDFIDPLSVFKGIEDIYEEE